MNTKPTKQIDLHGFLEPDKPGKPRKEVTTCGFRTYRAAVTTGQRDYGHGKFFIDTGDYVPSREEQLLIKSKPSIKELLELI